MGLPHYDGDDQITQALCDIATSLSDIAISLKVANQLAAASVSEDAAWSIWGLRRDEAIGNIMDFGGQKL